MKNVIILLAISVLFISIASGASQPSIKEVKEKHEDKLFDIDGVSGVSVDEVNNEIVVYIEKPEVSRKVPKVLDGYSVKHVVTGRIKALQATTATETLIIPAATYSRTSAQRPVFGGISLGNARFPNSAGTLGLVTSNNYVLSNAHILAMDSNANFVPIGTAAWQPGGYDGGSSSNSIGMLYRYIPIRFYSFFANNYADAAIATLTVSGNKGSILNATNNGFYTISGSTTVSTGDTVRKSGRSSGVTSNTIYSQSASVRVYYTSFKWAIFRDQILVNQPFIQAGDSGSSVDKDGKFVGLVFAGSDTIGVVSKAKYIISSLGITI